MTLQEKPEFDNIIKFLCGEASFYGLWFGDLHPSEPGQFWWRKHLKAHVEPLQKENGNLKREIEELLEKDRLQESIKQDVREEVTKWRSEALHLIKERDKLKSENEKLEAEMVRNNLDSFEGYKQMQSEIDSLKENNNFLKLQIEGFKKASKDTSPF